MGVVIIVYGYVLYMYVYSGTSKQKDMLEDSVSAILFFLFRGCSHVQNVWEMNNWELKVGPLKERLFLLCPPLGGSIIEAESHCDYNYN